MLTPKAFSMLRYLVEHAGQLVTKDELWRAVWPGISVTDAALTVCMSEIRKALGDEAKVPRCIQTLHRLGYRFIAPVRTQRDHSPRVLRKNFTSTAMPQSGPPNFVGRQGELSQLHKCFEKALKGERQIVFISGEPGIGKTSLVETFLQQIAANGSLWIGRGQCVEHYGAGEAYLPLLDALGRLCREPGSERLLELLDRYAPTWLVHMPALLSAVELEMLQRKVSGTTRTRMLRELAEAVEVITSERPLVLRLEDLHWSDYSTLEWLDFLARRQEPARLLVLGTYRPVEVIVREHPLKTVKQELQVHGQCKELPLGLLNEAAVVQYLEVRFVSPSSLLRGERFNEGLSQEPLRKLARMIHQRTDGNPLFMVNIVDYLIAQGAIVQADGLWKLRKDIGEVESAIPEGPQQMITRQLEQLGSSDRRLLEVASVAGAEFSVAAITAGLEMTMAEVEERCGALVRSEQFLRASGVSEWPDGTAAGHYAFIHALYQEIVYERVTLGRRINLHRDIGEWEERAYGDRAGDIAAELALHFERGRDYRRAVRYCQHAGENAVRLSAHEEAIGHLTRGLKLLATLPDTPERTRRDVHLQLALGLASMAVKGYAAPETERAYARARELCERLGDPPELFPALLGLWTVHIARAEIRTAHQLAEGLMRRAQSAHDPALLVLARRALGATFYWMGEFLPAREHLENAFALYDPERPLAFRYGGVDAGVTSLSHGALTLWQLGYPDEALKRGNEALALAQRLSHPFSLALAGQFVGVLRQYRREARAAQEAAESVIALSVEHGLTDFLARATTLRGWAMAEQGRTEEGIALIQEGLAALRATGSEFLRPYYLCSLAEAYIGTRLVDGIDALTEALSAANEHEIRHYESEAHRLKGELLLKRDNSNATEARSCFERAIEIARRQSARSWELRATTSLARLLAKQGRRAEACPMLAEIYNWFTEGFDTTDLKEAKALLDELGA